jgi:hypothetical protein
MCRRFSSGRYWARTSDLRLVEESRRDTDGYAPVALRRETPVLEPETADQRSKSYEAVSLRIASKAALFLHLSLLPPTQGGAQGLARLEHGCFHRLALPLAEVVEEVFVMLKVRRRLVAHALRHVADLHALTRE